MLKLKHFKDTGTADGVADTYEEPKGGDVDSLKGTGSK